MKNGDLSVTSISTSMLGQVSILSLKLNVYLYLYSITITSFLPFPVKQELSKLCIFVIFL